MRRVLPILIIAVLVSLAVVLLHPFHRGESTVYALTLYTPPPIPMTTSSENNNQFIFVSWVETNKSIDIAALAKKLRSKGYEVIEVSSDYVKYMMNLYNLPDESEGSPRIGVNCLAYVNGTIVCYTLLEPKTLSLIVYMSSSKHVLRTVTSEAVIKTLDLLGTQFKKYSQYVRDGLAHHHEIKLLIVIWTSYDMKSHVNGYYELSNSIKVAAASWLAVARITAGYYEYSGYYFKIDGNTIAWFHIYCEGISCVKWFHRFNVLGDKYVEVGELHHVKLYHDGSGGGSGILIIVILARG